MAELTIGARGSRAAFYIPRLGFWLAVLAVVLLALAPLGWRTGLWHFRVSFFYLMTPAAWVGVAAGAVSLISLIWWGSMTGASRVLALLGLVVGAIMFYVPWQYYNTLNTVPRIHDISTDTDNPPAFSASVLAARAAEHGNSTAPDPKVAGAQKSGYPGLAPAKTALAPAEAFKRALAAAQGMSGWTIVSADPAAGVIEANQRSLFFGFTDDIAIRVAPDGSGSRIDMRSESRQGTSDFGVNARRVRGYMEALKHQLG